MIRIEATYPATDGSAPERIEITWEGEDTPLVPELATLVDALAKVPRRYEIHAPHDQIVYHHRPAGGSINAPRWPSRSPSTESETPA